jgi:hypothetical protein
MFVRFKESPLRNGKLKTTRAELLQSYRDKITGKPTTKVVAYLGSLREVWNFYPKECQYAVQEQFWKKADAVFAKLKTEGVLTESEAARLKAKVEERCPRPPQPSTALNRRVTSERGLTRLR